MSAVFIVRDSAGKVTLDIANSLTKHIGSTTVTGSGSFAVPELNGKRGWVIANTEGVQTANQFALIRAFISGNVINYTSSAGTHTLHYGCY